ncbi:MAG TPA: MASE1 domain-containing protein, partial [Verrucomicrobiae bacterium]|nr:MASE1 domain-containing protein [Verrucomicrobiae bacterium]
MRAASSSLGTNQRFLSNLVPITVLAAVYFVAGKLGLKLAFLNQSATAVWPPTGIALAAVLLFGFRLWPGIWLGAFLVNITTAGSVLTTLGIATGNTLEAVLGAWLVERFANGRQAFERATDIFKYILLAVGFGPMISATFGVTSLALDGHARWDGYYPVWATWWLGDAVSALIIAPLIVMIWSAMPFPGRKLRRVSEAALILAAILTISFLGFGGLLDAPLDRYPRFLLYPAMLWAAYRFGQQGAIGASFIVSGVMIWGTLLGFGPFASNDPNESLVLLQTYMITLTLSNLVLGAVVSENRQAECALRKSEESERSRAAQLQAIMQAVPAVVWVAHDADCRIITGNTASYELLRLPEGTNASKSTPEGGQPTHFTVLQDGRELGPEELPVQRAAHGETVRNLEEEVRFADGTSRHLLGNATPLCDAEGNPCGAVAAFVDITARKHLERRLAGNLAITRILVASPTLGDATPKILRTICETFGWEVGGMWVEDFDANALRCLKIWHSPTVKVDKFESASYRLTFAPGVGLPGRVWTSRKPAWIPDITKDKNFPRAPFAVAEDLHGAFAFPIMS